MFLRLEYQGFQVRGRVQGQNAGIGVVLVLFQAEFDALPLERAGVGLYLHILFQQPVDRLLRFMKLRVHGGPGVQLELLLYGSGKVPAEEDEGVAAMAFGVQKAPGLVGRGSQGVS